MPRALGWPGLSGGSGGGVGAGAVFMGGGWRGVWGGLWFSCGVVHCVGGSISCFWGIFIIAGQRKQDKKTRKRYAL